MKFFDFVFAKKIFQYTSESMPMVINDIQLELLLAAQVLQKDDHLQNRLEYADGASTSKEVVISDRPRNFSPCVSLRTGPCPHGRPAFRACRLF